MDSTEHKLIGKIREIFAAGDIYGVLRPVYVFCKICGLNPLRGDPRYLVLRVLFSASLLTFCLVDNFMGGLREPCNIQGRCMFKYVSLLNSLLNWIMVILVVGCFSMTEKKLDSALKKLSDLDSNLERLEMRFTYTNYYTLLLFGRTLAIITHYIVYLFQTYKRIDHSIVSAIVYRLTHAIPALFLYYTSKPFVTTIYFVKNHFAHINLLVGILAKNKNDPKKEEKLEEVISIHNELCDLCDTINDVFGLQNFIATANIFTNTLTITNLVAAYSFFLRYNFIAFVKSLTSMIIWDLQLFTIFLEIVNPCHSCQLKAKEFSTTLYNMMIEDKSRELINNDKLQLHLAMKREVKFTACGFFPLDNTLIHSMVAATTTYLVILIQFGPYNEKKDKD